MADPDITQTAEVNMPGKEQRAIAGVLPVFTKAPPLPPARAVVRKMIIGRDVTADFPIQDGKVSRQHARLEPNPAGVLVSDLGSHNGTFVDGRRLSNESAVARAGGVLRVGETVFCVVKDITDFRSYPPPIEGPMVGGRAIADLRMRLQSVAESAAPVLIEGETGTGKEVAAEALHRASRRAGEFVAVNCAALPAELVESELFGHAKGSFSGSERARTGLFRTAEGGTLLLDEIGELPMAAQAKLLRVLETSEVRPVGEDRPHRIDVRIAAATNRGLDRMVEAGTFRADLFHRLAAYRVALPALRDRIEDVPLLCAYFLADASLPLTAPAMEALLLYSWPGNVRELRHTILTAATTARNAGHPGINAEDLPTLTRPRAAEVVGPSGAAEDDVVRERVVTALKLRGGNVAQVARDLEMARSVLYTTLTRLQIDPSTFRKR